VLKIVKLKRLNAGMSLLKAYASDVGKAFVAILKQKRMATRAIPTFKNLTFKN